MMQPPATTQSVSARRGSAYFAVLGASMVVAIIGMGALSIVRSQRLTVVSQFDAARARLLAESGVEWGTQLIASNSSWRGTYPSGVWHTGKLHGAEVILEGTDTDGSLSNRPTDSVTLKATVTNGAATQIVQATLTASGPPIDALKYAVFTGGQFHVRSGKLLTNTGAPVGTNGELRNEATITGDVECVIVDTAGTIGGTLTSPIVPKAMPSSSIPSMYAGVGTAIDPGKTLEKAVLTPTLSPFGSPNPDGVYVWSRSDDLTLRGVRIEGTLVVLCPGKKLRIEQSVFIKPARADYPALIVDGDLEIKIDSVAGPLGEADWTTNFNPAGAGYPYPAGATDSDQVDTYPNEIRGLVHCRGAVKLDAPVIIRGALIAESAASSDAVDVSAAAQVIYDTTLWTAPPMGYQKSVTMSVQQGSWRQVVLP